MQGSRITATLDDLGRDIFMARYAYPGETEWYQRAKVIAKTAASCELDEDVEKISKRFYDSINIGDFIPGGRIIFGSGRNPGAQNLLNCFVLEPQDSIESIGKVIKDMYTISCGGGGVGFNFSKIRPKGDAIQNVRHAGPGAISVMKMMNEIGNHVRAGGTTRRVALMGILNVTHPDILEFLEVKLTNGELTNFNISVAITNRFLRAVEDDEEWYFSFNNRTYHIYEVKCEGYSVKIPATGVEDALGRANEFYKRKFTDQFTIAERVPFKAKELWDLIYSNSIKSGDPGIFNIDLANSFTNVSYFEKLNSTNPCGEISLPDSGNCCLGHINLNNMILEDESDVDWKRLARTVRTGIRFLDNVLTVNGFPTEKTRLVAHDSRRIGLGVTGLHYLLLRLGYKYGDDRCVEFLERLFATIRNEAYLSSMYLAKEKGAFPKFDREKFLNEDFAKELPSRIRMEIKKHGIRNAVMLTVAPTGTISMVMGVSTGIEPIFSPMYRRRYREGNVTKEVVVVDPLFKKYIEEGKDVSQFLGAYEISPENHMKVQAAIQRYVDSCISKTINLPKNFNIEGFSEIVLEYAQVLKGLTIYRAGSKGEEPLEALPTTQENIEKYVKISESGVAAGDVCSLTGGGC